MEMNWNPPLEDRTLMVIKRQYREVYSITRRSEGLMLEESTQMKADLENELKRRQYEIDVERISAIIDSTAQEAASGSIEGRRTETCR